MTSTLHAGTLLPRHPDQGGQQTDLGHTDPPYSQEDLALPSPQVLNSLGKGIIYLCTQSVVGEPAVSVTVTV